MHLDHHSEKMIILCQVETRGQLLIWLKTEAVYSQKRYHMCNAENSCHTMFLFCYHDSNYQYFEENDCALTQQKDNGKVCFLHQSRKPHCVPKCNYFL